MNLSYAKGSTSVNLLNHTIGDLFDQTAKLLPENLALVVHHQNIRWTYKELRKQVNTCAKALLSCGIRKGDRIGIWSPNCAEWTVLQFATAKVGAILVNINPSYRLNELEYALRQSGCKMLFTASKFKKSNYQEMILQLIPEISLYDFGTLESSLLPKLKSVVCFGNDTEEGFNSWFNFMHLSIFSSGEDLKKRQARLKANDPINIQYTSGTTGYPKGATLSHHNILNNGYFVAQTLNFTHEDKLVIPVPLYHCFGMVMGNLGCITHGATMIYPSEGFEPEAVLKAVEQEKATALYGVPTMFIAELEHPNFTDYDLSSLRTGIMAGSPCPIEVMKKVKTEMHMNEVSVAYGMTETSPVSNQTRIGTPIDKQVSTVGQVHPHLEVKIIDPQTNVTLPKNTAGELCTKGYSVMLGYWQDEAQSKASIDSDGWMHTGDLGTMDDDGYVNIVGRIKDMIIRGGENIYPREIEEFLYTHSSISDVQVIGVADEKYGEIVVAWVKLKEGAYVEEEELKNYCKDKIAHFKVPAHFRFVEEFPMTVTGKVRKVEMRRISEEEMKVN